MQYSNNDNKDDRTRKQKSWCLWTITFCTVQRYFSGIKYEMKKCLKIDRYKHIHMRILYHKWIQIYNYMSHFAHYFQGPGYYILTFSFSVSYLRFPFLTIYTLSSSNINAIFYCKEAHPYLSPSSLAYKAVGQNTARCSRSLFIKITNNPLIVIE